MLMSDPRYKELAVTTAGALLLNLLGYVSYPGGMLNNVYAHLVNLQISSLAYSATGNDIAFNHSVLAGLKFLFLATARIPNLEVVNAQARSYGTWLTLILGVAIGVWVLFIENS